MRIVRFTVEAAFFDYKVANPESIAHSAVNALIDNDEAEICNYSALTFEDVAIPDPARDQFAEWQEVASRHLVQEAA